MRDLLVYYVGDENPSISDVATIDGAAQDLTGKTARFKMRAVGSSTVLVDQPVSNVLGATGELRYDWGTTDLDTAGFYIVWWEIKTGTKPQTVGEALIEVRAHSPLAHCYLELEEFRQALTMTGTYADPSFRRALLAASEAINGACGRRFWLDANASSVRYYTPASPTLVNTDDISTITTVQVDQDGDGTFEETWVLSTDLFPHPLNAPEDSRPYTRITVSPSATRSFPIRERSVKITGQYGWPVVPAGVIQATAIMANRLQKRERDAPFGVAGTAIDGAAVRIPTVDPDVMGLIEPFVRRSIA